MPSRRTALSLLGTAGIGAIAGCSSLGQQVGYVQLKSIEVEYSEENKRHSKSLLRVSLSEPAGAEKPQVDWLDEEWSDHFETPHEPVVSESLDEAIQRAYDEVRYVIGVCSPSGSDEGCRNADTSRDDFNRVQVHDRVTASYRDSHISIQDVDGKWEFEKLE
ncbi:hypothetical protein [Halopiger aswanensis]|uniref:hypothetical protein n=1 Tax=Halopiger aswanensis TaxID=148449 RepID=UPI000E70D936|nr:hypothetical protein [Halopiger aswanensis]